MIEYIWLEVERICRSLIAAALKESGFRGNIYDIGNAQGMVNGNNVTVPGNALTYGPATPSAVAETGVVGTHTDGAPHSDHVHPHGSGYLPNAHHSEIHGLVGADHVASGLIAGQALTALTATTFGFADVGAGFNPDTILTDSDGNMMSDSDGNVMTEG